MTIVDKTTEPAGVFAAHLARWEATEADPDGTVERVARAIWDEALATAFLVVDPSEQKRQERYRRLAAAAIDALRPAPDAPRVESGTVYGIRPHRPITAEEDAQLRRAAEAMLPINREQALRDLGLLP
jgi:hypothetical protein